MAKAIIISQYFKTDNKASKVGIHFIRLIGQIFFYEKNEIEKEYLTNLLKIVGN